MKIQGYQILSLLWIVLELSHCDFATKKFNVFNIMFTDVNVMDNIPTNQLIYIHHNKVQRIMYVNYNMNVIQPNMIGLFQMSINKMFYVDTFCVKFSFVFVLLDMYNIIQKKPKKKTKKKKSINIY